MKEQLPNFEKKVIRIKTLVCLESNMGDPRLGNALSLDSYIIGYSRV